jgi:hypothetical protein
MLVNPEAYAIFEPDKGVMPLGKMIQLCKKLHVE